MKHINVKAHNTLATPSKFFVTSMITPDTKAPMSPTNTSAPPHVPEYFYSILNTIVYTIAMKNIATNKCDEKY